MEVIPIPCFTDNYAYLVLCTETGEAAVVDPSDPGPVLETIRKRGASLRSVFNTHHHLDHVAGVEEIVSKHRGVRVFGHRSDRGRIPCQNEFLEDGDEISVGKIRGTVTHNPGHTSGGVSYFLGGAAFTGDTLFACGCGRLFEGSPEEMFRSLHEKIGAAPPSTRIYFGHEYTEQNLDFAVSVEPRNPDLKERVRIVREARSAGRLTTPTTLEQEWRTNPFLRCESREVRDVVRAREPGNDLRPVSVFRALRAMKDRF